MPVEPKSLARIAADSGFLMADVAFLAGLEGSTVSRLWDDPQWLDRVKGKSLQAIVSVLPGVGEYIFGFSLADRRSRLAEGLSRCGVEVDQAAFRCLVQQHRVPEQYLSNALETAICISAAMSVKPRLTWPDSGVETRISLWVYCSGMRTTTGY